jgi:SAM-dependent methyltransferase
MALVLHLGCGNRRKADAVNVDAAAGPAVDLVLDVDDHPWPWADGTVDEVHALHLFEHVVDPVGFMVDAWRVLRPLGLLHLEVPHWKSRNAYTDPTHRRYCTEETWLYWVPGSWLYDMSPGYHPAGEAFTQPRCDVVAGDIIIDLRKAPRT